MKNAKTVLIALSLTIAPSFARVKVAASIPDLASIAAYIGGNEVEVFSIARTNANPHAVEVLPSYMIKVSRVAVYFRVGLGLDAWADAIVEGSRNSSLQMVDCSTGIEVLEKPSGKVDASMGDVHSQGNPHYWLNPENGIRIAGNILGALKRVDPSHSDLYETNAAKFKVEAEKRIQDWKMKMAPLQGANIITYHSSWAYFAHAFGLRIAGYVEPFPGIPPTARHLQELVDRIREEKIGLLIQEPFYQDRDSKFLARRTGVKVFRFTPSCEGAGAGDYLKHFDDMVAGLSGGGKS